MTGPGTTDSSKEAPAPDARRPDASTFHHRAFTWAPLVVWLAAQILILLVPASQVRLADEFPRPAESMALSEMLAGQLILLMLTFPFLLRGAAVSIAIAASAWPFLLLAGVLASTPNQRIGGCALYLTVWIAVLAIWRTVLRTHALQMVGVAVGGALSVGLPLLAYLSEEFSDADHAPIEWLNPHVAWLRIIRDESAHRWTWGPPVVLLGVALAIRAGSVVWRRHRNRAASAALSA